MTNDHLGHVQAIVGPDGAIIDVPERGWPMLNDADAVAAGADPLLPYRVQATAVCTSCGCNQDKGCLPNLFSGETCFWVRPDLCSRCAPINERVRVAINNPWNRHVLGQACAIWQREQAARDAVLAAT